MSNTITIKHGSTKPTEAQLQPYELGYNSQEDGLYINNAGAIKKINDTSALEEQIKALDEKVTNIVSQVTGIEVGTEEPKNTHVLWIDISPDSYGDTTGVAKYCTNPDATGEVYNWTEVAATWG